MRIIFLRHHTLALYRCMRYTRNVRCLSVTVYCLTDAVKIELSGRRYGGMSSIQSIKFDCFLPDNIQIQHQSLTYHAVSSSPEAVRAIFYTTRERLAEVG